MHNNVLTETPKCTNTHLYSINKSNKTMVKTVIKCIRIYRRFIIMWYFTQLKIGKERKIGYKKFWENLHVERSTVLKYRGRSCFGTIYVTVYIGKIEFQHFLWSQLKFKSQETKSLRMTKPFHNYQYLSPIWDLVYF